MAVKYERTKLLVCAENAPDPKDKISSGIKDWVTESVCNKMKCDDCGADLLMPKSLANFLKVFKFDFRVCVKCFQVAVDKKLYDNDWRSRNNRLMTTPQFLSPGEWCMFTNFDEKYHITPSGEVVLE